MTFDSFHDALRRLIDSTLGELDPIAVIEALEGRIGVINARMEDEEDTE